MTEKKKISEDSVALRQKAEDKLKSRSLPMPEDIAALSPEDIRKTLHELRIHQIELEMQNEALHAAQADLEESRSRYFDLYDMAPVGYCTISEKGLILEANLTAAAMLETARSALVKQLISHFILKEDQDIYYLHRKQLLETGESQECELRLVKSDGALFWAHLTGTATQAEDGAPVCRLVLSDITNRKREEEVLLRNEKDLRESQRIAHVGSWRLDVATNQVVWTEELYNMYGFDPSLPPPPYTEHRKLFTPESWERLSTALAHTRETGIPYTLELETLRKDGSNGWMWVKGEADVDSEGKTVELWGAAQDITRRKQTEAALKASEKKYQSLFENAQVALFRNRLSDGKVLEINERYAKMAGYSNIEDCMAKFNAADAWVDPNGRNELLRILQENGSVRDYETEIMRRDGTNIWISFSATIFPEQGFLEGSIVEITERKRSEAEKEKLLAQLNQAQKMESVGRLAGGVAHDFNNMLGVILGHAEFALEEIQEDHKLYSDLKEIQNAAQRSADITKQLLAFARKQIISPRKLDLSDTVEGMLNMLRRLIGEDIDLVWKPSAHLWPVKMDPSQIDQILANLCINARDAISGVGTLTIETGRKTFDEDYCSEHPGFIPGNFVLLAVSDNGCGMDKDTLDNLFEPFFTTKEVGKGTGLGLATVYGIVKQNSGFINVYSEPGQGSTFKIYLPRLVADADTDKAVPEKKTAAGGTETILLVEDEPTILRMTRMMLERKGYSVLPAATPGEAIDLAKAHADKIHLLMTDVVMPEMNGRDLAGQITALYPDIKLLFMSGYTANVIAHQGILDDGVAFIQKPFSMADMTEKVRELLDMVSDKNQG